VIELKKAHPKILVVGDLMIDHYLWGSSERLSPEAPVLVVDVAKESKVLGGAGNVVNNLITLGASVSVASVIGDDENGVELLELLRSSNAHSDSVLRSKNRKTSKKSRLVANLQQVIRFDAESKSEIAQDEAAKLLKSLTSSIDGFDAVVLSDYGKGVLSEYFTKELIRICKSRGIKVLVDPKGSNYSKYKGAYLLTPNKKEAMQATNIEIKDEASLREALLDLKNSCELEISLITLSEDGIATYDDELNIYPTVAKEVFDVTGAGDTVIASIAFALSSGKNIGEAARFANLAAGVVVGKRGSATVSLDEIEEYESALHKSSSHSHIKNFDQIERIVKRLREQNRRIVFTNGCFDILHAGHVKYLEEAKSYGDVLIVGLNSDESIRRLKGESRPINTLEDRSYILASLEAVDFVVPFFDDTPYDLIKMIKPDILVKGGDYEGKNIVGSEFSTETKLVEFVSGKSTTNTIAKIASSTPSC
jgi:D-beta-D-heptose 7-phosphate kinase/D-beta-D-heptose 1-phosphate adenosyltransferase